MRIPKRKCRHCNGTGLEQDDAKVGKAMMNLRNKARLTLRELGARMSLSIGYLSDLEHGRKFWSQARIWEYMNAVAVGQEGDE